MKMQVNNIYIYITHIYLPIYITEVKLPGMKNYLKFIIIVGIRK